MTSNRGQKTAEKEIQILRENYFEPKIIYLLGQLKMVYVTENMTDAPEMNRRSFSHLRRHVGSSACLLHRSETSGQASL